MVTNFYQIFYAKSIAIIGASNNPSKATHQIIKTMLREQFGGTLYPIHPTEKEILGLKCHKSLLEIKDKLELIIIGIPAKKVLNIIKQTSLRGDVLGIIIISAGFSETEKSENIDLEKKIIKIAKASGFRIFGPNCIGIINSDTKFSSSFVPITKIINGNIGFITQSGSFGGSLLMLSEESPKPLGFNKWAHLGNMADVSNTEILEYFGNDDRIKVIGMYLEGLPHGKQLIKIAKNVALNKPIFLFKVGVTDLGARATFSHTGTIAGSDKIFEAAFKQSGIVRVNTIEELFDSLKAGSMLQSPKGRNTCVLTEAGGPGIIALDEISKENYLKLAHISEPTKKKLKKTLPAMATICKPDGYIDITAAAMEKEHGNSLRFILEEPNVDSIILISLPPTFLPAINVAKEIVGIINKSSKPVAVCFMKGKLMQEARIFLENHNIPTFDTPDRAARALINLTKAANNMKVF